MKANLYFWLLAFIHSIVNKECIGFKELIRENYGKRQKICSEKKMESCFESSIS